MSHIRRRPGEILQIVNVAFVILIILSILSLSVNKANASSPDDQSVLSLIYKALGFFTTSEDQALSDTNGSPDNGSPENGSPTYTPSVSPSTTASISPTPTDNTGTSTTSDSTARSYIPPEQVYLTGVGYIYGTPTPMPSSVNNNTTLTPSIIANETTNTTASNTTPNNSTMGLASTVTPYAASGQQSGQSGDWLALTLIAIPAILAALIVVIQFVRKAE